MFSIFLSLSHGISYILYYQQIYIWLKYWKNKYNTIFSETKYLNEIFSLVKIWIYFINYFNQ